MCKIHPSFEVSSSVSHLEIYVVAKHSARFKAIDLNSLTVEKKKCYADRFVQVTLTSDGLAQVFIGPNSPFAQELIDQTSHLFLDGRQIKEISLLSKEEYAKFAEEQQNFINAFVEEKEKVTKENQPSFMQTSAASSSLSVKRKSSFPVAKMASKAQQCFYECCKKTLDRFIEEQKRLAALDEEADDLKKEKKKELKEFFFTLDLLQADIRYHLLKAAERLKVLKSKS